MALIENKTKEFFVAAYKVAVRMRFSREQLAEILGIKPDSLMRRRLTIMKEDGKVLPQLDSNGKTLADITEEKLSEFKTLVEIYVQEHSKQNNAVATTSHVSKADIVGKPGDIFVITSAQNATPVHDKFWASLLQYVEHSGAKLIVIPYRYKNPTSIWTNNNETDEYWSPKVAPYIVDHELHISKSLVVMGHIKIHPTAVAPLSGFDSLTGTKSAIFGHSKIQLKTVPTPANNLPKILTTTGTVTEPNYTDSKAGHKAHFHHSLSATIVELDEDCHFHVRHVHGNVDDGSFYDLNTKYSPEGISTGHRILALVTGDTHGEFADEKVIAATHLDEGSIAKTLKPEYVVWHDLDDFYRRNHHHRGQDIINIGKLMFGMDDVEEGLQMTADLLDKCNHPFAKNVIVKSNHDEAFDRWLREADPKDDLRNSRFYHYMKYHLVKNIKKTPSGFESINPLEFWFKNPDRFSGLKSAENTIFLKRDESFVCGGIELGFHGDRGPNGSRGTLVNFSKIGPKTIIGHSHSPGIYEGAYQVGTSSKFDLEYVSGPSSWMHTHAIIYPNGSRTLIHIVNGKWHG